MSFSLDTSALIWAWRFAYPRADFPTLWQRFEALIRDGEMRARGLVTRAILAFQFRRRNEAGASKILVAR